MSKQNYDQPNDLIEEYDDIDHSGDPMAEPTKEREVRKSRRLRRREKQERKEQRRIEREKAQIRAEVIAELRAEGKIDQHGILIEISRPEGDDEQEEESRPERRPSRFSVWLMTILSGNILTRAEARRAYPYLLFVAFLAFIYIGNIFRTQQLHRKHEQLAVEVKELRAKSMTLAVEKMSATRQSNILDQIERRNLELKESLIPNRVIPRNSKARERTERE